jgi:hypothetical protein
MGFCPVEVSFLFLGSAMDVPAFSSENKDIEEFEILGKCIFLHCDLIKMALWNKLWLAG